MVDSSQPMEIDPVDDGPKQPMAMNIEDSTPPPPDSQLLLLFP